MNASSFVLTVCMLAVSSAVQGAPRVPASDDVVVGTLPSGGTARSPELRTLQGAASQRPDDVRAAVALARHHVALGRATGDPRHAGHAQAALARWWRLPDPPEEVRLVRAILAQREHRFDAALADLDAILARRPLHPQARLTRATLLQVRGQWPEAAQECARLPPQVPHAYVAACVLSVAALAGDPWNAYARLAAVRDGVPPDDTDALSWLDGLLAEMAERAGRDREAETRYRDALAAASGDPYLVGAYADFLLDRHRDREAYELTRAGRAADPLLLRHAIAAKRLGDAFAGEAAAQLRDRFEASRLRGDSAHQREEARAALELHGDAAEALRLARENWKMQKEPADAVVLLAAAVAADDAASVGTVRDFIGGSGLRDVRLDRLLRAAAHPTRASLRNRE